MEWVAMEKTQVVGTFPPRKSRGWTGYVEKDTAGQTNIYSVEVSTSMFCKDISSLETNIVQVVWSKRKFHIMTCLSSSHEKLSRSDICQLSNKNKLINVSFC